MLIEQAIKYSMLSMKELIHLDRCMEVDATGFGPSSLGIMQPEGRPNKADEKHKQNGYMPQGRTHATWE